jgi:Cellulose binding domain
MKRLVGILLAALATITMTIALPGAARAATATPSCTVGYIVAGQWSGFFEAQITVSFSGFPTAEGWTLSFDFVSPGQRIAQGWNGTWTQSGRHVTVTSGPYPVVLPSEGSLTLGFGGTYTTVNPPPTNFVFNGTACTLVTPVTTAGPA